VLLLLLLLVLPNLSLSDPYFAAFVMPLPAPAPAVGIPYVCTAIAVAATNGACYHWSWYFCVGVQVYEDRVGYCPFEAKLRLRKRQRATGDAPQPVGVRIWREGGERERGPEEGGCGSRKGGGKIIGE
jgi:hypothetical protein